MINIDTAIPFPSVDTNVPIPSGTERQRYPFRTMETGYSFFIPADQIADAHRLRSAASHYAKRKGWTFTIRKVQEDGVDGYRCWRTA
jgi:hypothetical protein